MEEAGYGNYFNHRLGRRICIKTRESPYLNNGNFGAIFHPSTVFTAEPRVYILDKFGVRHENVLLVKLDGEAENLSGGFAIDQWTT
jgi:Xaa-Pro aminopeptidase